MTKPKKDRDWDWIWVAEVASHLLLAVAYAVGGYFIAYLAWKAAT